MGPRWVLLAALAALARAAEEAPAEGSAEAPPEPAAGNSTGLFQIYQGSFRNWVKRPIVHGLILPGVIGMIAALLTVCCICCIHSCAKNAARQRRKRRIRNLAEELKTDKAALLEDNSSDEDM